MHQENRSIDVFIAHDGTEFQTESECLQYEAQKHRAEARRAFVAERTKTVRSEKSLTNMLEAYDRHCAIWEPVPTLPPATGLDEDEEK